MTHRLTRRDVLAGALAAGAVALTGRTARAQALPVVRVAGQASDGLKGVYYAIQSGIFKKYGIDVQPTLFSSGSTAAAALSGNAADVAYTNTLTVAQASAHGIPMQYVATGNFLLPGKSPTLGLALKDSPIKTGRDLNGKILASVGVRDINALAMMAWIDKTGGDSATVKIVEVPASAGAAFLQERRADAVVLNEPFASQAIATGNVRVLCQPYDVIAGGMAAGLVALQPYVDANRDTMTKFGLAMHEASTWTNAHQAETVPIVAGYSGIPADVIAKGARFTDADYVEARYLQPLIDLFAKYGAIDKPFPASQIIAATCLKPPR
jgi:NitT/TauT family transport system substrate-binding protein